MKSKKSKAIAHYAQMSSDELHEEYMSLSNQIDSYYFKDILSEAIDKLDWIEALANKKWYDKIWRKP
jgi:hypothetical protein